MLNQFSTDYSRGITAEKQFESIMTQEGIEWQKTPDDIDKNHLDYIITIGNQRIGVDVKVDKWEWNKTHGRGDVAIVEWAVNDTPKSLQFYTTYTGWDLPTKYCCTSWAESSISDLQKLGINDVVEDYICYVTKEGLKFISKKDNALRKLFIDIYKKKKTDSRIYHQPGNVNHRPYVLSGNQNARKICWCMYLPKSDLEPYFKNFSEIKEKHLCMSEKSSTFAVFS